MQHDHQPESLREKFEAGQEVEIIPFAGVPDPKVGAGQKDIHALSLAELNRLELPEHRMVLPWLREGGLAMVFGSRGLGKTFFSLGVAVALVTGQRFIRWDVPEPVGVLYVDGEMQLRELRERINSLAAKPPIAEIEIVSHEHIFERADTDINLGQPEWQDAIKVHLETKPTLRVVIIDNLSCLLPGIAEDKRDDWAVNVLPFLIWMRRRGVAVILVHHAGKSGGQRGTSSREDQLDTVIKLSPLPDADPTQGAQFRVDFTKSRSAFGDDVKPVEVALTEVDDVPTWSWKDVQTSNDERLIKLVRDGIENVSEAAIELDMTPGAVSKIKKRLISQGRMKNSRKLALNDWEEV